MPRLKAAELLAAARAENFAEHELERTAFNMTGEATMRFPVENCVYKVSSIFGHIYIRYIRYIHMSVTRVTVVTDVTDPG